ncbi:hypothetical protein HID58_024810 [Brassica napus]|uniref:Zinc knuckle CX2CX4HX4C domain-containing protein n=1 Tax=Brassica napus TaxID=3708 RepID=A0ABQ8CJ88_BRANA|nr:hypothetical protein HID58_024810 [Brassica napus]
MTSNKVVDESYPSLVPFWIQLQGIPLHLCTHQNLEAIGDRLGKVDKIDSAEGKIRVEIDSSKPLKFTRKLQTRKKEDINIKLHYEMLFKHCSTCGLMTHETQYCTMYQSSTQSQLTGRETVFDRVRPSTGGDVSSRVPSGSARVKDEIARPHKDGASSYARVHRSTHSSRSSRVTKPRDSRYNPYSYVRSNVSSGKHQEAGKEQDTASASAGNTKLRSPVTEEGSRRLSDQPASATVVPKLSVSMEQPPLDNNVTYRPHTTQLSHIEVAEDLIPPYNALKIDALNEHDIENEEEIADAYMEDNIMGNELALIEDEDMLGEDLAHIKSLGGD